MVSQNNIPLLLVILLVALVCHVGHTAGKERKKGTVHALCGDQFISAWYVCCGKNPKCENSKREIPDGDIVSPATVAKRFLESGLVRRGVSLFSKRGAGGATNPVEECCYEKCSLSEVAEYDCI